MIRSSELFDFLADFRMVVRAKGPVWGLKMVPHLVSYHRTRDAKRAANERVGSQDGFDKTHGTDTSRFMWGAERGVCFDSDGELAFATGTTPSDGLAVPLSLLDIDCRAFVFVDLGCGLGKPLMVASQFPFKKLIGLDLSAQVIAAARKNIDIFTRGTDEAQRFDLLVQDASKFVIPDEPTIYYMYNPFGQSTLERVVRNIEDSLRTNPRKIAVIYNNPICRSVFQSSPFFELVPSVVRGPHPQVVYASKPSEWARPKKAR
jgi:SAM-dependent methyltransferase